MPKRFINIVVIIGVPLCILIAASIGKKKYDSENKSFISASIGKMNIEARNVNTNKWEVIHPQTNLTKNYIYTGEGKGYNGPIRIIVVADTSFKIKSVHVLSHSETYSYYNQLSKKQFLKSFEGKNLNSIGNIDAISGATWSSTGIINGVSSAYAHGEGLKLNTEKKIRFGFPEFLIMVLFALAIINTKVRKKRYVQFIWWLSMLSSIFFIGFIYNQAITTARINSFLLGFWPSAHSELFVYLLVSGAVLSILLTGKNHYCHTICPFGASQELIGKIGNAKAQKPTYFKILKKIQWSVSFLVVVIALVLHNPGATEYEIYGGLFSLTATIAGFILLLIIIFSSLFIKRPWCSYLCPLSGIFKYFSIARKEARNLLNKTLL